MGQPLPRPTLLREPIPRLATVVRTVEGPERRRLRRGLLWIGVVGIAALAYLCLLVRVSAIDVKCFRLRTKCDELRATIAADMTELSALSDRATNLDQAERNGLQPTEGRDRVLISGELCRSRTPQGGAAQEDAGSPPLMAAGMGAP